jgi:hypothetical protein
VKRLSPSIERRLLRFIPEKSKPKYKVKTYIFLDLNEKPSIVAFTSIKRKSIQAHI